MIVVLSANTAVDRILHIPHFSAGSVWRADRVGAYAGGKGLNVARVLHELGGAVRVVGFLGGYVAPSIRAECTALGIEQRWTAIAGQSRTCTVVVDEYATGQTVLNEPGPEVTAGEIDHLLAEIEAATGPDDILSIAGSAPPGVPESFYPTIIARAGERGVRVLVDATGPTLRAALAAHPWAAAPNREECAAALGPAATDADLARRLGEQTEHALLTMGADGVLYAAAGTVQAFQPVMVQAVNAVGSGDAFVAGFLSGMERGLPPADAVRLGMACGAANAARFPPGIGSASTVAGLLDGIDTIDSTEGSAGPVDRSEHE